MSRKPKIHYNHLADWLSSYAKSNLLEFKTYSPYHLRLELESEKLLILDVWTTGKYYVAKTNYQDYAKGNLDRSGEKGRIKTADKNKLYKWLDKLFYPDITPIDY